MFDDAALAILCGGQGLRMGGVEKGLLLLGGESFMQRLLALSPLFADTFLVTSNPRPYEKLAQRTVADTWVGKGAPGALHTALCSSPCEWTFVIAVDMPLMTAREVEALALQRGRLVDVCCAPGHPLGAFYRSALREPFGVQFDGPRTPSLKELLAGVRVRSPASLDLRAFVNVNTEEELRAISATGPSPSF